MKWRCFENDKKRSFRIDGLSIASSIYSDVRSFKDNIQAAIMLERGEKGLTFEHGRIKLHVSDRLTKINKFIINSPAATGSDHIQHNYR